LQKNNNQNSVLTPEYFYKQQ